MPTLVTPHLLERDGELRAVEEALQQAAHGDGRLLVVEGPAGIGKTRLVREARERAGRLGMATLTARASELERDFPFGVVRQLLEPPVAAADPARREQLLAGAAAAAAPVLGLDGTPPTDAATDPTFASLNGLYWLVSNLVEASPTLVTVDDAHWCDPASLRFLTFLLARLEELPVLLVVATRPAREDAALARLASDPLATLVHPQTLTQGAVADVVRDAIGLGAADEYCAACLHVTGGNPFLLHELLAQLASEGGSGAASEIARVRSVVPATIAHAVLVRVSRLPEPTRDLAHAAAVLGDGTELRIAAALAGLSAERASAAAGDLARVGVLEPERPLRFTHPLIRNAIYRDAPAAARIAAHARAAELLRDEDAEPERIALHLVATEPAGDEAVAATLRDAARRALDRAAPEAAVTYLRRALRERPGPALRRELIAMLVTAGLRAAVPTVFDDLGFDLVADALRDPAASTAIAEELSIWLYATGRRDEGSRLLAESAAAAARAGDHDLALTLEAQRVVADQAPLAETAARLAAYPGQVPRGSAGERLFCALDAYTSALTGTPASAAVDIARRALDGGRIFAEEPLSPAPYGAIWALIYADELAEAEVAIEQAVGAAARRPMLLSTVLSTAFRGHLAFIRGEVSAAEPDLGSALELLRRHQAPLSLPTVLAWLMHALTERDEPAAAERVLTENGMPADIPPGPWLNDLLFQRGLARLGGGRLEAGIADVLEAGRREGAAGRINPVAMPWASVAAVALLGAGRAAEAQQLAEDELARARAWGTPRAIGTALRAVGLVEGGERGRATLEEAVELLAATPAGLEHARALTDLGAALRRANQRAAAREPLHAALENARRAGALAVARAAHSELEATGERLRPLVAGGVESLTPSERRVAEQAALGKSNREIAQTMFLTVKTVETHLTNTYRKLDIESRRELPAALG